MFITVLFKILDVTIDPASTTWSRSTADTIFCHSGAVFQAQSRAGLCCHISSGTDPCSFRASARRRRRRLPLVFRVQTAQGFQEPGQDRPGRQSLSRRVLSLH